MALERRPIAANLHHKTLPIGETDMTQPQISRTRLEANRRNT